MSFLQKAFESAGLWMLSKSVTFDGQPYSAEWHERNGFKRIAAMSGGSLSADRALETSAFFAGTKVIAEDMGSLPFFLYDRGRTGNLEKASAHGLFYTLAEMVNPEVSSGEFVEALTANAIVWADGFAKIQRVNKSVFLWPWKSEYITVDQDSRGNTVYVNSDDRKTYLRDEVFHLKGFTFDGRSGDQILKRARKILQLTAATHDYAGSYFENDATPGIVVTRPREATALTPEGVKLFIKTWVENHRRKKHEPTLLQEGMDVKTLTPTADQVQLIEQRKFQVIEVCRVLRLQPAKLADHTYSTYTNTEQQGREYVQLTLSPWVARWKRAVHRCLLTADERLARRLYAEHDVEAMQRGDFATQAEGWRKLLEKGVYSINEVRRWLNLNPIEGGDEHFIQLNLGTVQDVASGLTLAKDTTGTMPVGGPKQ